MIFFLCGDDEYRLSKKLTQIIDRYKEKHQGSVELIKIEAKEVEFTSFWDDFQQRSIFVKKRLFILRSVFQNKDFAKALEKKIDVLKQSKEIIVIEERGVIKKDKQSLRKALNQHSQKIEEFKKFKLGAYREWLREEAGRYGLSLTREAEEKLADYAKLDTWRGAKAIEKIAGYKGWAKDDGNINSELVEFLIIPFKEVNIFTLLDCLVRGDKKKALKIFMDLSAEKNEAQMQIFLVGLIATKIKNLFLIKNLAEQGISYQEIIQKSKLHPYAVSKLYSLSRQFSWAELKKIYRQLFTIDLQIKTGQVKAKEGMASFILSL